MRFEPQTYNTIEEMNRAFYFNAQSDTIINDVDVFGYVNGVAYATVYEWDEFVGVEWAVAGEAL